MEICLSNGHDKRFKMVQKAYVMDPLFGTRAAGRPATRWEDDLSDFAGSTWFDLAPNQELWGEAEEGFVMRDLFAESL